MNCPYCDANTQVTNSRSHNNSRGVWRRRQCKQCNAVWTTTEQYDLSTTHRVVSAHQTSPQPFSRDILFVSIKDSLQHRKTAVNDASALTDTIIAKVLGLKTPLISTQDIIQLTHDTLNAFDPTSAAVYGAVHGINSILS